MSRRTNSSSNIQNFESKGTTLPFTRILTGQASTVRIKKIRINQETSLPPCADPKHPIINRNIECDSRDEFERLCHTGRYKFVTEENEMHKGHQEWALAGRRQLLTRVKKDYNEMLSKINILVRETAQMQKELKQRQKGLKYYHHNTKSMQQFEQECQLKLEQMKYNQIEAEHTNRVWTNIQKRMQDDKIVYLKRKIQLQETLTALTKKQIHGTEVILEVENEESCYKQAFRSTRKIIKSDRQFRMAKVNQLNELLSGKNHGEQFPAQSGLPNSNPEHVNLLMAQLFIDKMLKSKCARLKERYQEMEKSFEMIKKGIVFEQDNLVGKFLSQNQSFEGMQGIITLFEGKLKTAKDRYRQLLRIEKEMNCQQTQNESDKFKAHQTKLRTTTAVDGCSFRIKNISGWIQHNLAKFNNSNNNNSAFSWSSSTKRNVQLCSTEVYLKSSTLPYSSQLLETIGASFKELCQKISIILSAKEKTLPKKKLFRTDGIIIKKQFFRLGAEQQRQLQAEKQNVIEVNKAQVQWLKQVRLQAKQSLS